MKKIVFFLVSLLVISFVGLQQVAAETTTKGTFTKIGPQVFTTSALTAKTGTNDNGTPLMYILLHGTPTVLAVVDLNTDSVIHTFELDSTSAWGLTVDNQNTVWVGGTSKGNLYSFNPNTSEFVNHGNMHENAKDTSIQDIAYGNKTIFGGSAYGGSVFGYSIDSKEVKQYGTIQANKEFAKSVAYSDKTNTLFVGIGSNAELVEVDVTTGRVLSSFLPNQYKDEKYISDLDLAGDLLFARMYPSAEIAIFNVHTKEYLGELAGDSRGISPLSPDGKSVYYFSDESLFEYNLDTKKATKLDVTIPQGKTALSLGFVQLENKPDLSLVGLLDNQGTIFVYNLETKQSELKSLSLPGQPITLYTMIESEDKKQIFVNGYMSGGLGVYNVETGQSTDVKGISQVESIAMLNGKMYFGGYPKARVLEYDVKDPWGSTAPRELFNLTKYRQERLTAMVGVESVNKLYIGSFPDNGEKGGALVVYDPATKTNQVIENYIPNHSIVSLTYHDGYVYGGTSIFANQKASKYPAKFFRFPVDNPTKKEIIPLPINGNLVTGMITGPDGQIWGMINGTLFAYDPATQSYRWTEVLPKISGRFMNAKLLFGIDGQLYATVEGMLTKVDPATLQVEILKYTGAYDLAQDYLGNLYFRDQADLWKYSPNR
ncbi:WD40 repeat domain-containing protein [Fredinandcohnia humi]